MREERGLANGKQAVLVAGVAVGLTMVFWWPLWSGGGFIGGDLYSYFLPQKQFFAEHWQQIDSFCMVG